MTERTGRPWLNYLLGLLCAGAIVVAILVVGPASGSQNTATRTAKVAQGVVQSTVSGSGNLQPASQLNLGFKTGGTVTSIKVTQGQHVTQGRLLATLDPQSAEVALEQSKASLLSAEASLAREEETDGEGSSSGSGTGTRATAAYVSTMSTTPTGTSPRTTPSTGTSPTTGTVPSTTTPSTGAKEEQGHKDKSGGKQKREGSETSTTSSASPSSSSNSTLSAGTREANIASARAAVKSDQLTVQSDEQAVQDTKLYAPEDGTIVTLSGQVGEVVSASGTTRSSSDSSGSSETGTSGSSASATGRSAGSAGSSSSSSSSSSSAFAVLSDLSSMQLVVALSESEIGNVKVGQIATVTVEALEARKLAAHVHEVATLSTSSSGVVSYDVTFQLDQMTSGLKPGMSATAEVVVKQAEGLNVPSSAISADSVTVVRDGKDVHQRVTTGLAGNSATIVLSGVKAGETVVLPEASSTSSGAASLTSRLSRLGASGGGLGGGGAGGGFAGGGGAAFFRGGG